MYGLLSAVTIVWMLRFRPPSPARFAAACIEAASERRTQLPAAAYAVRRTAAACDRTMQARKQAAAGQSKHG